jgi:hypothetical protein
MATTMDIAAPVVEMTATTLATGEGELSVSVKKMHESVNKVYMVNAIQGKRGRLSEHEKRKMVYWNGVKDAGVEMRERNSKLVEHSKKQREETNAMRLAQLRAKEGMIELIKNEKPNSNDEIEEDDEFYVEDEDTFIQRFSMMSYGETRNPANTVIADFSQAVQEKRAEEKRRSTRISILSPNGLDLSALIAQQEEKNMRLTPSGKGVMLLTPRTAEPEDSDEDFFLDDSDEETEDADQDIVISREEAAAANDASAQQQETLQKRGSVRSSCNKIQEELDRLLVGTSLRPERVQLAPLNHRVPSLSTLAPPSPQQKSKALKSFLNAHSATPRSDIHSESETSTAPSTERSDRSERTQAGDKRKICPVSVSTIKVGDEVMLKSAATEDTLNLPTLVKSASRPGTAPASARSSQSSLSRPGTPVVGSSRGSYSARYPEVTVKGPVFVVEKVEYLKGNNQHLLEGSNRESVFAEQNQYSLVKQKPHVQFTLVDTMTGAKRVEAFSLNKVLQKIWA